MKHHSECSQAQAEGAEEAGEAELANGAEPSERFAPAFSLTWLLPKYWLNWLLLAGWRTLAALPWGLRLRVGALLGAIIRLLSGKRRRIARANIRRYAERPDAPAGDIHRRQLERAHFRSIGMGLAEAATAWWSHRAFITDRLSLEVTGTEHIQQLQQQGRGILLLPLHYTFLELLPALIHLPHPLTMVPRPHNNPLIDYMMHKYRLRWLRASAEKDGPWSMLQVLRQGGICIYFADQDYGTKGSLFAPFFGTEAATTVLGRRMAQRAGAAAVLLEMRRQGKGYISRFHAFDEYLQAKTDAEATALLHARFEEFIDRAPEQWFWSHRRFKTRPPNSPHIYPGSLAKR